MNYRIRFLLLFLFSGLFLMSLPHDARAQDSQKSWWEVFFPSSRNIPAETLTAPFADKDAVIMEPEGDSVLKLDVRHRPNIEVAEWAEQKISELLIYTASDYEEEYRSKVPEFDTAGLQEYLKFLQDNNILKPLSQGVYDIKGFAKDLPIVLNEGAINGRYRWLLQVPIMVTFVKNGTNDYKELPENGVITAEYTLNIQVGRSKAAANDLGVLIESWKAAPVQPETK